MKRLSFLLFVLVPLLSVGASLRMTCPDGRLSARVEQSADTTFLVMETRGGRYQDELTRVQLGFSTSNEDFSGALTVAGQTKVKKLTTQYTNIHGKQREVKKPYCLTTVTLQNAKGEQMDVEVRLYNDGMAFRYLLPTEAERTFTGECTAYSIAQGSHRWLQKYVTSYEGDFPYQAGDLPQTGAWGYPALFENAHGTFMLITEANATRMYCTTHLDNSADANQYKVSFPFAWEGREQGSVNPSWKGCWASPWRVVIAGGLKDIVESTLVDDVSDPPISCRAGGDDRAPKAGGDDRAPSWIQPGRAAWVYWAYNHGTKDYKTCCAYVDLAAEMGWEYVLFDWEWDAMTNGGKLEDAVAYALSKGVKPWIWYNSGGNHTWVRATPLDRMLTHENRVKEFTWLKGLGIVGVKVDFFESDKQNIVNYYLDILEDAEKFEMMVNFHGCTVPRGWSHTYPHLMSQEAVYGAEQYNNAPFMTDNGARINCLLPYTRNVVGPMDYTPVAFTNSQHPHRTTYTHELALSVAFESGVQHWADRPEGFRQLPEEAREHMKQVPVAWDETRFLQGYPGKSFVVARRSGNTWYVAGLNGTNEACNMKIELGSLGKWSKSKSTMTLFTDGKDDKTIDITSKATGKAVAASGTVNVSCLPMGGFLLRMKNEE